MGYAGDVLKGAWEKTYKPLGWDRRKYALALLAACGVAVVWLHFGTAAMKESAIPLLWTVAPLALAAVILFIWGIIETQGTMYAVLSQSSSEAIGRLQAKLEAFENPLPHYDAWRLTHQYNLQQAAFLWEDVEPGGITPKHVSARYHALASAVQTGALDFVPTYSDHGNRGYQKEYQRRKTFLNTIVSREQLKAYAAKIGGPYPRFLLDAD